MGSALDSGRKGLTTGIRHDVGKKNSEQLGFIDDLQKLGLGRLFELPQLIVVGDQNTGKSSVLQAITELPFPVNESMCTRFPTEVVFRRSKPGEKTIVNASIEPGKLRVRDAASQERMQNFSFSCEELSPEIMGQIITEATGCIFGVDPNSNDSDRSGTGLSDAILRIERSGPGEKHWSIVDLPGLIQNKKYVNVESDVALQFEGLNINPTRNRRKSPGQRSPVNDIDVAKDLVRRYLKNKNGIILAVIDPTDYQRHTIFSLMQDIPDLLGRLIGIITKCDMKQEGSDTWITNFLKNKHGESYCYLKHGWFALRNRKPKEAGIDDAERDKLEAEEFCKPDWDDVPRSQTGIASLMAYVDAERSKQIKISLPILIEEIQDRHNKYAIELAGLGRVRNSPQTQRLFLWELSTHFHKLSNEALDGRYEHEVFEQEGTKLRLAVQERLQQFADEISACKATAIPFGISDSVVDDQTASLPRNSSQGNQNIYEWILKEARTFRGTDLPGDINCSVRRHLFRKQITHWRQMAKALFDDLSGFVTKCSHLLFIATCADHTLFRKLARHTKNARDAWLGEAKNELEQLLEDNQQRLLLTLNPEYSLMSHGRAQQRLNEARSPDGSVRSSSRKDRRPRSAFLTPTKSADIPSISSDETDNSEEPSNPYSEYQTESVHQIHDSLLAYYNIALWRFVDNVAMQVVERHLLGPRSPMQAFSPEFVGTLGDKELDELACEDNETAEKRAELEEMVQKFQQALDRWEEIRTM